MHRIKIDVHQKLASNAKLCRPYLIALNSIHKLSICFAHNSHRSQWCSHSGYIKEMDYLRCSHILWITKATCIISPSISLSCVLSPFTLYPCFSLMINLYNLSFNLRFFPHNFLSTCWLYFQPQKPMTVHCVCLVKVFIVVFQVLIANFSAKHLHTSSWQSFTQLDLDYHW